MTKMVDLRLATRKLGGSERFSCNLEFWTLMIELGTAFGWQPVGATYVAIPIRGVRNLATRKRDYEPETWQDAKLVEADDALRWANALSAARSSPRLNNLAEAHRKSKGHAADDLEANNRRLDGVFESAMDEFIRYLHKGGFSFTVRPHRNE